MFDFNQDDTNVLFLTVLRLSGSEPAFPSDYAIPQIRISHVIGGSESEDLAFASMTQIGSTNQWFYEYDIPTAAPVAKYMVTYKTTLDGIETFTTEEFRVVPVSDSGSPGTGEFAITLTVKQSITLLPISGAILAIFDKSNPTVAIATAETDSSGSATVFLDAGSYLAQFTKTGVISETHDLTVNGDGSHDLSGD